MKDKRAFGLRQLKALDDNAGLFEGYLAVFRNQDGNGDIIDRGAFQKTLREAHEVKSRDKSQYLFPILWQHKESEPIGGFLEAYEDDNGLYVKGELDLETDQGRRAYSGLKRGYIRGLSIGYETIKQVFARGERHLTEVKLWEGSPVTFPANDLALVTQIKAVTGSTDWPLAPRDRSWDAGEAHGRLMEWAGGKDNLDVAKFKSVHFWSPEGDAAENVSEYKFPFCDIIDGSPKAVYGAISAGAGRLESSKGVDIDGVKAKMSTYYSKMAKTWDDDSIKPPWSGKALADLKLRELKQLSGMAALQYAAQCLDDSADCCEDVVELLAQTCGMSITGETSTTPHPTVSSLLGGVDGLEDAVKATIASWQEFSAQTDALLGVLGLPDNDFGGYGMTAMPMYMSQLLSALETKAGRQLSAGNRARLAKVGDGLSGHVEEIKSILRDNDKVPENDQDINVDQRIAGGKSRAVGGKPDPEGTTSPTPASEPDPTTLADLEATVFAQSLETMRPV